MPRVNTATKNKGGKKVYQCRCGHVIQPGEKYFSFKFRYGGTHYRCAEHYPKPSELTQSKVASVLEAIEIAEEEMDNYTYEGAIEDFDPDSVISEFEQILDNVAEAAEQVRDEYQEALDAWEFGNSMLQEKVDEFDTFVDTLRDSDLNSTYEPPEESEYGEVKVSDLEERKAEIEAKAAELAAEDGNEVDDGYLEAAKEYIADENGGLFDEEGYEQAVREAISTFIEDLSGEIRDKFGEVPA